MNLFREGDDGYQLFMELTNADSSTLVGHSIKIIINSCESKDDFDWLVTQLKDYVAHKKESFVTIVGEDACDLIRIYKPFQNDK